MTPTIKLLHDEQQPVQQPLDSALLFLHEMVVHGRRRHRLFDKAADMLDTKRQRIMKRVRFAPVLASIVPPTRSRDDVLNTWYNDAEYQQFESACGTTLRLARELHTGDMTILDSAEHTMLGLEPYFSEQVRQAREIRVRQHRRDVLATQPPAVPN